MTRLRSSNGKRSRSNVTKNNPSSVYSLPTELIAEVLALVGSSSSDDLFRTKMCVKMFKEAADYNFVYKKVSLKKFPVVSWRSNQEFSHFMRRCKESENPEALFRQGMIDFFTLGRHEEGLEALGKAANTGHGEALYIMSVILLLSGDDYTEKGIELLREMRKGTEAGRRLKEYRENLKKIMASIWITSPIIRAERRPFCAMQGQHKRRSGWDINDDEISCDACRCDIEVDFVYKLFPCS